MDSVLDFKTDLFSSVEFHFCPDVSSQGSLRSDKMVLEKMCDNFKIAAMLDIIKERFNQF